MSDQKTSDSALDDLPFHEYCAHCKRQFDGTILDPTVTIVEAEDGRAIHSFCDEDCLSKWADK